MTLVAIDHAEVRRIARLAHLELDPGDDTTLVRELQSILDHVASLDELDLESVPATADRPHAGPPLREDTERASLSNDEALASAPDHAAGYFRVPRVLGE